MPFHSQSPKIIVYLAPPVSFRGVYSLIQEFLMQDFSIAPDITEKEIEAVTASFASPNLSLGPKLPEFEEAFADYIGRKHAIAVNSGTSALYLCMLALGIGPGDEVITTPFTFIATTNTVLMVGAKPVLVDIDPVTYNIDFKKIESKITKKTKAIMPVEVFGNPARYGQGLRNCPQAQSHRHRR